MDSTYELSTPITGECAFCEVPYQNVPQLHLPSVEGGYTPFRVCPFCHAFIPYYEVKDVSSAERQALFHEEFFGISEAYDSSYLDDTRSIRRIIIDDYPEYFGNKNTEIVCEVGAGRGHLLKALRNEGYCAFGCEFSSKLVAAGRKAYGLPDDVFFPLNAWKFPQYLKEKSINPTVIVFWHVIEHVAGSIELIESIVRVCSTELTVIFQTPLPTPEYVYPEHLFFPSSETYHYISDRLGLEVKLLEIVPYKRFITCVLSNKLIKRGAVIPRQSMDSNWNAFGQLLAQLNEGLIQLDQVTKEQHKAIVSSKQFIERVSTSRRALTLCSKLEELATVLRSALVNRDHAIEDQQPQLRQIRDELIRAEAQLDTLKDVMLGKEANRVT